MKKFTQVVLLAIMSVTTISISAQTSINTIDSLFRPYHLPLTRNKTTTLLFPYAIKSVDMGSADILAQKAKGIENVLQIKAAKKDFEETNLTVITADGMLYTYILNYADNVPMHTIGYAQPIDINYKALFSEPNNNMANIQVAAQTVAGKKRSIHQVKDKRYGIKLMLNALYVKDNVMYYLIKIENNSNIDFDIDQLRFFIRDERRSMRTASQELEVKPLYVYNSILSIKGKSQLQSVFAMPKLTIPDGKYLLVQMTEKSGGRNLRLRFGNRTIVNANPL